MNIVGLSRSALGMSLAVAMLAGCGLAQTVGPGIMPQGAAPAGIAAHGNSWMLPEAKGEDLLYVSSVGTNEVYVFSYPQGKKVGTLANFDDPTGKCVDKAGDVWIVNDGTAQVFEFSHGGTNPIATLSVPGSYPFGCAIDPATGNLAVTNGQDNVSIYANAQGTPTTYTDGNIYTDLFYCTYDNQSNLFVTASYYFSTVHLDELPNVSSNFRTISLNQGIRFASGIQWDGQYLAYGGVPAYHGQPVSIYQVQVSGSQGTVVGTTQLFSRYGKPDSAQFWLQGNTVIQPSDSSKQVGLWKYPAGGNPYKLVKHLGGRFLYLYGIAVSLAK